MPSQPLDPGWNFSSVYDLIVADPHNVGSPTLRAETRPPSALQEGVGLGDFGKLYQSLGWSESTVASSLPPVEESDLSNSDDALLPSPILRVVQTHSQRPSNTSIISDTNAAMIGLSKKQRQKARKQAEKACQEQVIEAQEFSTILDKIQTVRKESSVVKPAPKDKTPSTPSRPQSNVGAKIRAASPVKALQYVKTQPPKTPVTLARPMLKKRSKSNALPATPTPQVQEQLDQQVTSPVQHPKLTTPPLCQHPHAGQYFPLQPLTRTAPPVRSLVPSNVRPAIVPRLAHTAASPWQLPPTPSPAPITTPNGMPTSRPIVTIRAQVDRHFNLFNKLVSQFPDDRKWLVAPRQLVNEETKPDGVHVFVDASNIMIGFKDMLRNNGIQPYDMSFDSLALLMERRRPVAKRVFVGSHREANPLPQVSKLVETSKAVGYECNVQEQVYIVREESEKRKFFNDVKRIGWHKATQLRSGSGSDSETGPAIPKTPSAPKWVEQGVDELLHLKMCQSIIDIEQPTTMILATGDGAAAEMSDGFLAHVERALRNGWKVELITWRQQTNAGYKRKAFRQKWGEQFTIIELDDFLEDLIDTP